MFLPGDRVRSISYPDMHKGVLTNVSLNNMDVTGIFRVEFTDGCTDWFHSEHLEYNPDAEQEALNVSPW